MCWGKSEAFSLDLRRRTEWSFDPTNHDKYSYDGRCFYYFFLLLFIAAIDVMTLVMIIVFMTIRVYKCALGMLYCCSMKLSNAGVKPSPHIPVIVALSEAIELFQVDIDVTR